MEATPSVRRYVLFRKSESRVGGVRVRRLALAGVPRSRAARDCEAAAGGGALGSPGAAPRSAALAA